MEKLIESETIKQEVTSFTENAIGAFLLDPVDLYKVIKNIWSMHSRIRDGIYWENFVAYLFHVYDFDEKKKRFINNNKKKLAEMLAEDTPNQEAGYKGNPERLRENVKIPEEIPERMMVGPARLAGIEDVKADYETLVIKRRN